MFLLAFFLYLCLKGRRNNKREPQATYTTAGIDEGYEIVSPGGRTPGEGSPRQSGGEADTFLQRSPANQHDAEVGGRGAPGSGVPRVPVPGNGSLSSSGSSTNNSGYGTLIERPTLNLLPITKEELARERRGPILTREELERLEEEEAEFEEKAESMPLVPPPRLLDPGRPFKHYSSQLTLSGYPDAEEAATLLTARRVRVDELASRSTPLLPMPTPQRSINNSGGFFGSLRRLSWFRHSDSGSGRNSRAHELLSALGYDEDVEAGKSLLGQPADPLEKPPSTRGLAKGLGLEMDRPASTVSGQSGATVFYDAPSSLPATPISAIGTPPAPLPRALTPSGLGSHWPSHPPVAIPAPPAYSMQDTHPLDIPNDNQSLPMEYDVLDMPAPTAVSRFSSIPSDPSLQTSSATATSGSFATYPLPPGLMFVPSKIWTDSSSLSGVRVRNNSLSVDILEEEPPSPGESWRNMAEGVAVGKRTTFGRVGSGNVSKNNHSPKLSAY